MREAHISIDDVRFTFHDLIIRADPCKSIFQSPVLAFLNKVHRSTGAKFSLYGFTRANEYDIADVPDRWKGEFEDNSDWLKFGFHWPTPDYYPNISANYIVESFNLFCKNIIRFAGFEALDSTIRLHYFHPADSALFDSLSATEFSPSGLTLLCSPNRQRTSYDLTKEESSVLYSKRSYTKANRIYIPTDLQLEAHSLREFNRKGLFEDLPERIEIFTHEWALWSRYENKQFLRFLFGLANYHPPQIVRRRLINCCNLLSKKGVSFI